MTIYKAHIPTGAFRIILYLIIDLFLYVLLVNGQWLTNELYQILLIVIFFLGLRYEKRATRERFFTMPPAIFSSYIFVQVILAGLFYMKYGIGEWRFFNGDPDLISRISFYSIVATHSLWIGYSILPVKPIKPFNVEKMGKVSDRVILIMIIVSLASLLVGIKLGVYGYAKTEDGSAIISYIRFLVNLGLLAIVLMVMFDFEDPKKRRRIYVLLVVYFVVGLAFGSKTTALSPLILFVLTIYLSKRRMKASYFIAMVIAVFMSYIIIEPFRIYYQIASDNYDTSNPIELARMYKDAFYFAEDVEKDQGGIEIVLASTERQNYVAPLAMAVSYADDNNFYIEDEWENFALSPLYAIIPRFIWKSKPLANFSQFASVHIFGSTEENRIGITPIGYAYLVGRLPAILLIFLIYGIVQKVVFNILFLNKKLLPVYIVMLLSLSYPNELWTFVGGTIKEMVMLVPVFYILTLNKKSTLLNSD